MQIVGIKRLDEAKKRFADIRGPIDAWTLEVREAMWDSPQDIKNRYSTASFLENGKVFFNIKGNNYRLLVQAEYPAKLIVVEWIGTHAEYSKKYC